MRARLHTSTALGSVHLTLFPRSPLWLFPLRVVFVCIATLHLTTRADQEAVLKREEQQRYMPGLSDGAGSAEPSAGGAGGVPLLSVFQTQPLPDNSPLKVRHLTSANTMS